MHGDGLRGWKEKRATVTLWQLARKRGVDAGFVATGQTGLMVGCDAGAVIDRIPADFVAGQVEKMVLEVYDKSNIVGSWNFLILFSGQD